MIIVIIVIVIVIVIIIIAIIIIIIVTIVTIKYSYMYKKINRKTNFGVHIALVIWTPRHWIWDLASDITFSNLNLFSVLT